MESLRRALLLNVSAAILSTRGIYDHIPALSISQDTSFIWKQLQVVFLTPEAAKQKVSFCPKWPYDKLHHRIYLARSQCGLATNFEMFKLGRSIKSLGKPLQTETEMWSTSSPNFRSEL